MTSRGNTGRMDTCRRCRRLRRMKSRGLCHSCYCTEWQHGRLEDWPLVGGQNSSRRELPVVEALPVPSVLWCAWCRAPLTRSRVPLGEWLYELYTVNGRLMAVCFEGCPEHRALDLLEVA